MTRARLVIAVSLLFLISGALAGMVVTTGGVEYRIFGMTEGIFALFLVYVLVRRGVWHVPSGPSRLVMLIYGAWGTAQLLELLFPPPGLIEWVVVPALVLATWAALLGDGPRERLAASMAVAAVLLALLNFSIVPTLWARSAPAADARFGIGSIAEGLLQIVVAYQPIDPDSQILGVVAVAVCVLATRLLWSARD